MFVKFEDRSARDAFVDRLIRVDLAARISLAPGSEAILLAQTAPANRFRFAG